MLDARSSSSGFSQSIGKHGMLSNNSYHIDRLLTRHHRHHVDRIQNKNRSMEKQDQAPEEEEEDEDARRQLEGLRVVYGACCQFWLTAEAAAGAESTTGLANSLPLSAAMMLDRWSLLLHPDRSSCITPDMIARKVSRLGRQGMMELNWPACCRSHVDGRLYAHTSAHHTSVSQAMLLHNASKSPLLRNEVRARLGAASYERD